MRCTHFSEGVVAGSAFQSDQLFTPCLERQLHGQLSYPRTYRRTADNSERWRCKVRVRCRKLWMVQGIEKLGPNLKTAFLTRPMQATSAIRTLDTDLRDVVHVPIPAELSSGSAETYSLGYDIVRSFSPLGPDNARIAGDELMDSYSWLKQ